MKRVVYLAAAAMVALLILAPAAMAQATKIEEQKVMEKTEALPSSGGPAVSSVVLPATALLVGSGVMAYAIMRRRR